MNTGQYTQTLLQAGLSEQQAKLYEVLVKYGALPASSAARHASMSRTVAYHFLGELIVLGLVAKIEKPGKIITFEAAHPLKLKEFGEKRIQDAQDAKTAIDGVVNKLVSDFNLRSGKPGVQFFEGEEGIKTCLSDMLDSRTEIYSYINYHAVSKSFLDISNDFAKQRKKFGIFKKNIGSDSPENRKTIESFEYSDITEERLIPWETTTHNTAMNIYDNKVSYFTLIEPLVAVIIQDPNVYAMHKTLFETLWNDPRAFIPNTTNIKK